MATMIVRDKQYVTVSFEIEVPPQQESSDEYSKVEAKVRDNFPGAVMVNIGTRWSYRITRTKGHG